VNPGAVSQRLPDFPWDHLAEHAARARAHPDGIVDLSIGTPVDPTPDIVRRALAAAADAPGYPQTVGLPATRQAAHSGCPASCSAACPEGRTASPTYPLIEAGAPGRPPCLLRYAGTPTQVNSRPASGSPSSPAISES